MQGVHFRRVRGKRQQVRTGKRCLAYDWMYILCIDLQVQLAGGMRDGLRCLRRDVAFGGSDLFLQEGHLQAGRRNLAQISFSTNHVAEALAHSVSFLIYSIQPMVEGPCDKSLKRWHYAPESGTCIPFIYTGCAGNRYSCVCTCTSGGRSQPCVLYRDRHPVRRYVLLWLLAEVSRFCLGSR